MPTCLQVHPSSAGRRGGVAWDDEVALLARLFEPRLTEVGDEAALLGMTRWRLGRPRLVELQLFCRVLLLFPRATEGGWSSVARDGKMHALMHERSKHIL